MEGNLSSLASQPNVGNVSDANSSYAHLLANGTHGLLPHGRLPHGRPQCAVHFALVWPSPHGISQCPTLLCTPAHADRGTVSLVMPWCCCAVQLQWWRRGAENDPWMPYSRVPVCGQESMWSL